MLFNKAWKALRTEFLKGGTVKEGERNGEEGRAGAARVNRNSLFWAACPPALRRSSRCARRVGRKGLSKSQPKK